MSKLLFYAALAFGGYWLYTKLKSQPVTDALPNDATQVKTVQVAGIPVNVYLASNGYYAEFFNPNTQKNTILGPYSQAQVSALLNVQTSLGTLMGSL